MAAGTEPDLEERVAALEARLAPVSLTFTSQGPSWAPLTEAEEAELRERLAEALGPAADFTLLPLRPGEIRQLLSECVTVVKPGEALAVRIPWDTKPRQVAEYQRYVEELTEGGVIPFRVLVLAGDELAVIQPEPDFMSDVRADTFRDAETRAVRLTHLPTGVTVEAPTRGEAIPKLGRAIERHARRRHTEHPARDFPPILAAPIPVRDTANPEQP